MNNHLYSRFGIKSVFIHLRYFWTLFVHKKKIIKGYNVSIIGHHNIDLQMPIEIGLMKVGFVSSKERTLLNIEGKLIISGTYSISTGVRIDVGKAGVIRIGKGGYINSFTKIIIHHSLTIGNNCMISWDCQFLDEDFHSIKYDARHENNNEIVLGDNIWVGCGVKVYKGSFIADGCVIASDSIVKGRFLEKNVLIAGNPAKVIKRDVFWS